MYFVAGKLKTVSFHNQNILISQYYQIRFKKSFKISFKKKL